MNHLATKIFKAQTKVINQRSSINKSTAVVEVNDTKLPDGKLFTAELNGAAGRWDISINRDIGPRMKNLIKIAALQHVINESGFNAHLKTPFPHAGESIGNSVEHERVAAVNYLARKQGSVNLAFVKAFSEVYTSSDPTEKQKLKQELVQTIPLQELKNFPELSKEAARFDSRLIAGVPTSEEGKAPSAQVIKKLNDSLEESGLSLMVPRDQMHNDIDKAIAEVSESYKALDRMNKVNERTEIRNSSSMSM